MSVKDSSLNRQGKNCKCHPAHSFLFIIIMAYAVIATI